MLGSKLGHLVRLRRLQALRNKLMDKTDRMRAEGKDKEKDYRKIFWVDDGSKSGKFYAPSELYRIEWRIGLTGLRIMETLEGAIDGFVDENSKIAFKNVEYYRFEDQETIRFERQTGDGKMIWGYVEPFKWDNAIDLRYTENGKFISSATYSMSELYSALRQIYFPANASTL